MHAQLVAERLAASGLTGPARTEPVDVVEHLLAVQAQDVGMAQWAVARRTVDATLAAVQHAVDRGEVLRTHVLRPTWHLVRPHDLRWLLHLTGERVRRQISTVNRSIGLSDHDLHRGLAVITAVLDDGRAHRRDDLAAALAGAGLASSGTALAHQVMHAETRCVAVSGPRDGAQHTYVAFDHRVPPGEPLEHDEALARLAAGFVRGHGPARDVDLAWWSGLTLTDCRRAFDAAGLAPLTTADGATFRHDPSRTTAHGVPAALLLPAFDEYISHQRSADDLALVPAGVADLARATGLLVVAGRYAGTWRRTARARSVRLDVASHVPLDRAARDGLEAEAARYGEAVGLTPELTIST